MTTAPTPTPNTDESPWEEDTDEGYDEGSDCRRWGQNAGVYVTKETVYKIVHDLMFDQDIYGDICSYQDELARMVRDFTMVEDLEPHDMQLLIMRKEDHQFLRWFNRGPLGPDEPCAPEGYQGADVDAGWDG